MSTCIRIASSIACVGIFVTMHGCRRPQLISLADQVGGCLQDYNAECLSKFEIDGVDGCKVGSPEGIRYAFRHYRPDVTRPSASTPPKLSDNKDGTGVLQVPLGTKNSKPVEISVNVAMSPEGPKIAGSLASNLILQYILQRYAQPGIGIDAKISFVESIGRFAELEGPNLKQKGIDGLCLGAGDSLLTWTELAADSKKRADRMRQGVAKR